MQTPEALLNRIKQLEGIILENIHADDKDEGTMFCHFCGGEYWEKDIFGRNATSGYKHSSECIVLTIP